ncbi:hypothetical protein F7725_004644 [Dissostichus mawsoni]|uniref:Uncharacterized protein n=1 Tax=Dissostichus mawsoni TaxID=36200 RepID=A0A7J5XJM8_DISMA|nr:hypothetical protein F7725_004644 [Dissostichus mawsoni]
MKKSLEQPRVGGAATCRTSPGATPTSRTLVFGVPPVPGMKLTSTLNSRELASFLALKRISFNPSRSGGAARASCSSTLATSKSLCSVASASSRASEDKLDMTTSDPTSRETGFLSLCWKRVWYLDTAPLDPRKAPASMPQPGVSSALDSAPPDESGHRWPGKAKEEGLAHNSNTGNCKAASQLQLFPAPPSGPQMVRQLFPAPPSGPQMVRQLFPAPSSGPQMVRQLFPAPPQLPSGPQMVRQLFPAPSSGPQMVLQRQLFPASPLAIAPGFLIQ